MQFPGPAADWIPLSPTQFLSPAASTGLAIPNSNLNKGVDYVAILIVQGDSIWLRTDGAAAVAATTGGVQLSPGDYRFVYGLPSLKNVRAIRASAASVLVCEFYTFKVMPI